MGDYRKYIEDDIRANRTPMHREKLQELDEKYRKAKAFDEIVELEPKNLKYVDRPHLLRNQIKDIIWQYESEELDE